MATHRKEILAIALPAIISNLTTPVLGLVDVALAGRIGAAVVIGAIAVGGAVFNMLYWIFNFLRMGTSGLTAQACGACDRNLADVLLWRSLLVALLVGSVLMSLSQPMCDIVLDFMDADGATAALAARYFDICIFGAPAVLCTYSMAGWFIGMQDSKAAMWMSLTTNAVNICVSVALVYGAGMGIEGVAFGTMIAQWSGALIGASVIIRRYRPAVPRLAEVLKPAELASFFRINSDIFLRTCCLVAVTLWFTHAGAIQSADILAANAVLLQLFMLFSFFMDGFAYAGEALSGKYTGRRENARLRTLVHELMLTGVWFAFVFGGAYALAGDFFVRLLADDASVADVARQYMLWAALMPLCGFSAFIWDGILVGLTATRVMLTSMGVSVALFFILYFSFSPIWGNDALWLAFDAYLLCRGVGEWLWWRFAGMNQKG
ncbi:MAG: MATE family efflux transporter [Muribaculaceae bacterium]|nr:MATE family efflux transporter [Muribaculaceae bacterium]